MIKILADHGDEDNFSPFRIIIRESPFSRSRLFRLPGMRLFPILLHAIRCWFVGLGYPGPCAFVTIGSAHGFVLAFLQWLARPFKRPHTHVMFDLLLEKKRQGLIGLLDHFRMKLFDHAVDAAVVWGEADTDIFAREYAIPRDRLVFQPHHITLEQYAFEIRDDGFIFAGGNHGRDYRTLIDALGGVRYPVFIATEIEEVKRLAEPYPHIVVQAVSSQEYRQRMAASTMVVEAHPREFFRTAGHQTFLNAMWMGKPFIMADRKSALGYFQSGKHWVVVDAGDVDGLRNAVQIMLTDRDLATQVARQAMEVVRMPKYRTLNCMQDIYNLAIRIEAAKRGLDPEPLMIAMY